MLFEAKFKERGQLEEFRDIAKGLYLRDCRQKFGEFRLGILWALVEPIIHILTFTIILSRTATTQEDLVVIPVFVTSGLIPFLMFRSGLKGVMTSCKINKAAFFYPKVKPIHAIASKVMFEVFVYGLSFVSIYASLQYFSYIPNVDLNAIMLVASMSLLLSIGVGIGLIVMVFREFVPSIEKWLNVILRPLYFFSAIFYSVTLVPKQYLSFFQYNPCVHAIEFVRQAVLGQEPFLASWTYLLEFSLLVNALGVFLLTVFKDKLRSK